MQNDTLSIHPSFRLSISSKNLIAVNSDVDTDVCTSICLSLWVHPSPSPPRPPLLPMPLHLIMLGISKKLFLFFFVFLVSHLCLSQRMDETDETNYFFFNVGPPKEDIFSDHLLWFIFQSSLHTYYKL